MLKSQYKSFDELPLSLNMTEVAGVLGISSSSAYELARMDSFPSFRVGNRILVTRDAFKEWLDNQSKQSIVPEDRRYV